MALFVYLYGEPDHAQKADVIVVLGAGVKPNGLPTSATLRRTLHGIALYRKGIAPYVLCTGGYSGNQNIYSEAASCASILRLFKVPDSAILLEEISTSTEENAIEARKVMLAHNLKSAVVVSDQYHLLRASLIFQRWGIAAVTSPDQVTAGPLTLFSAAFGAYREVIALIWYAVKSLLKLPYTASPF